MSQLAQPALHSSTFPTICHLPQLYCDFGTDLCCKLFLKVGPCCEMCKRMGNKGSQGTSLSTRPILLRPHTPIVPEDLLSKLSQQLFQQQGFIRSPCWPVTVKLAEQISLQEFQYDFSPSPGCCLCFVLFSFHLAFFVYLG